MRNFSIKKSGFTILEIIVAVAIIGILASIVILNTQSAKFKARDTQRISDLQQVRVALRTYRDAESTAYPSGNGSPNYDNGIEIGTGSSAIDTLIAPYVSATVKDPMSGTSGYAYYYNSKYSCNGNNHIVLVVSKMEGSAGNFSQICGAPPMGGYANIFPSVKPTVDSYIVILK